MVFAAEYETDHVANGRYKTWIMNHSNLGFIACEQPYNPPVSYIYIYIFKYMCVWGLDGTIVHDLMHILTMSDSQSVFFIVENIKHDPRTPLVLRGYSCFFNLNYRREKRQTHIKRIIYQHYQKIGGFVYLSLCPHGSLTSVICCGWWCSASWVMKIVLQYL